MKNLFIMLLALLSIVACKKDENPPVPVQTVQAAPTPAPAPAPAPTFAYGCDSTTWQYEVLMDFDTSSVVYGVDITYTDGFGNSPTGHPISVDTLETWTSPTFNFQGTIYPLSLSVSSVLPYHVKAKITLNLYREGQLVQTTGQIEYCKTSNCATNTVDIISLLHNCS